jgi:hypothetical protein
MLDTRFSEIGVIAIVIRKFALNELIYEWAAAYWIKINPAARSSAIGTVES